MLIAEEVRTDRDAPPATRIKVAGDILDYRTFFVPDDQINYDEAAFDKRIRSQPDAAPLLAKFKDRLSTLEPFDAATIEKTLHDFVAAEGFEISQLIHPLRVAVTGQSIGFGLFETLAILGRESSVRRIDNAAQANLLTPSGSSGW